MSNYAFYIDTSACSGCKACQIACKDKNNLWPGINWRRVNEVEVGEWKRDDKGVVTEKPEAYCISMSCNHCEDPPCVAACPSLAIHKTMDGLVVIDKNLCIGCMYCEWSCPYGALHFDAGPGVMTKCDACEDYLYMGQNPACVDACPMRVISFGYKDQMIERYGDKAQIFPLPAYEETKPGLVIKPHPAAEKAGDDNAVVNNTEFYRQ